MVCVSFFLVQIFLSQLLTRLTTKSLIQVETFEELYKSRNEYQLIAGTTQEVMIRSENYQLETLGKRSESVNGADFLIIVKKLKKDNTALFARSTEIESLSPMLNPDRFAILEEKYFVSQYVFLINKKLKNFKQVERM